MKLFIMALSIVASITLVGCGDSPKSSGSSAHADHDEHADHDGHDHSGHDHSDHGHAEEGPHQGSLIELGNEAYHAEMVHDEATGTVTVYLLDSAAKTSVPIDATELLVNLTHDSAAEQFKLAANPQENDPEGKSSRFVSTDAELVEDLDLEGVEAKLVTTIAGKQYRGDIHHDHEGHQHGEGEHDHDHSH